jgi:hypothetical protein
MLHRVNLPLAHAQAKPKAYVISETEVLDAAALAAYSPLIRAATDAAGGRRLSPPGGTIVAFAGEPPKRVGSRSGTAWRKRRPSATRQPTRTWLRSVTRRSRQYGHMPSRFFAATAAGESPSHEWRRSTWQFVPKLGINSGRLFTLAGSSTCITKTLLMSANGRLAFRL